MGNTSRASDYQDGNGKKVASAWHKWNSDVSLGVTPTADTFLEITVGRGNGNANYAGRSMDGTRFARESFGLQLTQKAISSVLENLEVQGWYHYTDHIMDNHARYRATSCAQRSNCNQYLSTTQMRNNVDRLTWGGRGISTWQWQALQLQGGADIQINRHRKKAKGQWQEDAHFQDTGVFAELSWQLKPINKYIGGVRLEHTLIHHDGNRESEQRSEIYPALFLRYEHYNETLPLMSYIGLGSSERFPDYWELITLKSGRGSGQKAFYRLKREKTQQVDIGSRLQLKRFDGWVSSYAGYIKDFILFRYDVPYVNASRAENIQAQMLGAEMGINYRFNDYWRMESSLAWSFGKNLDNYQPLPQIPPLEGRLTLKWESGAWKGTGIWRLTTAQNRISINEGNVVGKDFANSTGFGVLSAHLAWQSTKKFQCSAGIDNLFNRNYSEHLNLAGNRGFGYSANAPLVEPGRTLWAKADIRF